jgi:cephalosporin-C deacetylase-like acetyl esterase
MNFRPSRRGFLRLVSTGLVGVAASISFAQPQKASTNYSLTVSASRADAIYKRGEKVTFEAKLLLDQQPVKGAKARWGISKDGVPPKKSGRLKLAAGRGTITAKLREPGFLQCEVKFQTPAGSNLTAVAGAGIDPLAIKPSLPPPADFDAFWTARKERLAQVPANSRLTPLKSRPGIELFDLKADCIGAPVSGYFAKPTGAKPKSLPIILTVQGAGVRNSNRGGTVDWAQKGFLAMDINAHGIANDQADQFYADLADGELKEYATRGRESRETVYFLGMFLREIRALDFLTAQPEWDGRTVVVFGGSQGGAQAFAAAGLDSRVTFFAALVPAMCDHTAAVVKRVAGWPKLVPKGENGKPDAKVLEAARFYDAMNFATRTKAAAFVTVGFIDVTCPPTSVYAAYNALQVPKEIFNDPPSTHVISPKAMQAARDAVLRHVEAMKNAK